MWGPDVCHHYIVLGVILENTNIVELTGRILPELAHNLRSLGQRGAGGLATVLTRALALTSNLVSHTLTHALCCCVDFFAVVLMSFMGLFCTRPILPIESLKSLPQAYSL